MSFPATIKFVSDDTEAAFVEEIKATDKKGLSAIYKFTKAKENLGRQFPLFLKDIERLKKCGLLTSL